MELGDRMKMYEGAESNRRFMPQLPICIRLDGKCFHNFTKELDRPFDERLHKAFVATMKVLVEETNALIGYTQSDEITLILHSKKLESQLYFDGKINKINSVLASICSVTFNKEFEKAFGYSKTGYFDCRSWQVPNLDEAANVLVWRELDATRNSVQMAARAQFSHKQCMNKNCSQLQEMLFTEKGINWNDYPVWAKKGTYLQRITDFRPLTEEELKKIPEKHQIKDKLVLRTDYRELDLPPITKVENKCDAYFNPWISVELVGGGFYEPKPI